MRSEILPEPFCKELEKRRTNVEPMTDATVREVLGQDIVILRSLVKHASPFMGNDKFLDLKSVVDELWHSLKEETDSLIDASNLKD